MNSMVSLTLLERQPGGPLPLAPTPDPMRFTPIAARGGAPSTAPLPPTIDEDLSVIMVSTPMPNWLTSDSAKATAIDPNPPSSPPPLSPTPFPSWLTGAPPPHHTSSPSPSLDT